LAGALFLSVIFVAFAGGSLVTRIAGNGTFPETVARIAATERLYRVSLTTVLIATLSSTFLAFALYATLRPASRLLAQLALIFNLEDAFLALIVRMCAFVRMHFYAAAQTAGGAAVAAQASVDLMRTIGGTTENLGGSCFGIGLGLFYYLFFRSRYIPRFLSALGTCSSVIWTGMYLGNLVFPEQHELFQKICFPPMALADIGTGFYPMLFAVKSESTGSRLGKPLGTTQHSI
jgi:hypothetical protein